MGKKAAADKDPIATLKATTGRGTAAKRAEALEALAEVDQAAALEIARS